ncbi:hypothetical protein BB2000_3528 [Proteus mirabilis BB2000]|nr:hypothetical protein BB2000_3528 [Proteus mirabilis BB2000]
MIKLDENSAIWQIFLISFYYFWIILNKSPIKTFE